MSTDDEDQGHSINNDYRMAGLRGDDETDLEDDREELFGSAVVPVYLSCECMLDFKLNEG
jgi:hypothetical protein